MKRKSGTTLAIAAALSIVLFLSSSICPTTEAQNVTTLSPTDKFNIPDLNGSINFAVNGSYSKATLDNGIWVFEDLTLYNPQGTQYYDFNISQNIKKLEISAQDSNITIWAVATFNYTSFPVTMLGYTIEGEGEQTVNLGLSRSHPTDASEWSIVVADEVFLSPGKGWTLMPDDTVLVEYQTSNVTIIHFSFLDSIDSGTVFYLQHSAAILTMIILATVIIVASIISYRQKKPKKS